MTGARGGLRASGLCKAYAAPVLADVDIELRAGEVHALVGANGAGKSTLTRLLCGLERPDRGTMALDGVPFRPRTRREAEQAGVQLVLQELTVLETLTVAENLFLTDLPRRAGIIDRRRLDAAARRALAAVHLETVDPRTPVAALGVGQRQLVEIARALARPCRVLVLDEPTAALTATEAAALLAHLARLRAEGLAVLYISHRLREVGEVADRVTVLRDGRVVVTAEGRAADRDQLLQWMTGATVPAEHPRRVPEAIARASARPVSAAGAVALRVEGLRRGRALQDVSFDVRRGEIVGLAGLVGAGRTETLRAIVGADARDGGSIRRGDGPPLPIGSPRDAVRAGIGLLPEDRAAAGLLLSQSVRINTTLGSVAACAGSRFGWIDSSRERRVVAGLVDRLNIRCRSVDQPVATLSGGNQQKVVLARWLLRQCDVLLIDEPTRGVDAAATHAIHAELAALAGRDVALVVVSSDLHELMAIADRIVVLSGGRVTGTFERGAWTEAALLAASFAGHEGGVVA